MFLTERKLEKRIQDLERFRYTDMQRIPSYLFWIDEEAVVGAMPPEQAEWQTIRIGDRWKGWDKTVWLKTEVDIPREWAGRTVVGLFDFGKTGPGHTSGFESLLYLNGEPFHGVGGNHQEVFLPEDLAGTTVQLLFKLWTGLNGHSGAKTELEHQVQKSALALLHEETDDFYYTSQAVYQTVMYLKEDRWERQALLKALDRVHLRVDWRHPGDGAFYESIVQANADLKKELDALPKNNQVTIRAIGHSHIDIAWLWQLKHTREKAARSFSTVLRNMERYPEFIYLQTMPHIYDDLQRDYPVLFDQIRQRVAEGRWEAGGAMWLESDCNIPSGESLTRQLLYGIRYFERTFGQRCEYLWLPDVFGYSWALPQILQKVGIRYFMTIKISWNQYNRFPHDTFYWRGIDGTKLLTHFITAPTLNGFQYNYSGQFTARTVSVTWEQYQDKAINDEFLFAFGHGDGGGGPTREMLEMRRRFEQMPGLPKVVTGRADEYFKQLEQKVEETDQYVHTWDGELYLERHRGTYTSQAYVKKMNRRMEGLLHDAEWFGVMSGTVSGFDPYPKQELDESWIIVLRNQFHDILPGSSIAAVYEDCHADYERAEILASKALHRGIEGLRRRMKKSGTEPAFLVLNTMPWERSEIVKLPWKPSYAGKCWKDAQGNELRTQRNDDPDSVLIYVPDIPAFGYTTITCCEASTVDAPAQQSISVNGGAVSTPYYDIRWNAQGQLISLFDKRTGRELIAEGEAANRFDLHEDKPLRNDAWDIDIFYYDKVEHITDLQSVRIAEEGALRTVVRFKWRYENTVIEQDMLLYADSPRIDFVTRVDWQERARLLKVAFPLEIRAVEATHEIQFGHVKRPTHWNTSWDYARFESCAQRWIDLSERGAGVSLLNDCKYGHDVKDNVMRLTLLKSAVSPDPKADEGIHEFTYALLPHEGDWFAASTIVEAHKLNLPVHVTELLPEPEGTPVGAGSGGLPAALSFFRCLGDHVVVDTVKRAEDSDEWIVRCYEFAGKRGKAIFESHFTILALAEVNLLEREASELPFEQHGFTVSFRPFEIKTFRIRMESNA